MGFKMKYDIKKQYLPVGSKKRPGNKLSRVVFLVAHDTGNSGSTASGNVGYYRRTAHKNYASAQIFVDDDTIIECIPAVDGKVERAYHVIYDVDSDNRRYGDDANDVAIGIELCFGGSIDTEEAYKRYVWVLAYLCDKFGLDPDKDIAGHDELDPARKIDPSNGLSTIGKDINNVIRDVKEEIAECTGEHKVTDAPKEGVHYIKKGETLWSLSQDFGVKLDKLKELNPKVNPSNISVGQKIILKEVPDYKTYTIEKGDTLSQLAIDYDTTVGAIKAANPGINPRGLSVGQEINIETDKKIKQSKPKKQEPKGDGKAIRPYPGHLLKLDDPYMRDNGETDIQAIQRALDIKVDGIYGPQTASAVESYQSRKGLTVDGIVGENTWNMLF